MPNATHAPRLTGCNLIGLRRETANIIPLTAPRPLRTRESRAMRRGVATRFLGVESVRFAVRARECRSERVAHLAEFRVAAEAAAP